MSKLIFARPEPEDEGIYICLATNNIGFSYKEARLTVLAGMCGIVITLVVIVIFELVSSHYHFFSVFSELVKAVQNV